MLKCCIEQLEDHYTGAFISYSQVIMVEYFSSNNFGSYHLVFAIFTIVP